MLRLREYHGIIIKEGLKDPSILDGIEVLGKKRAGEWTLLWVSVRENKINKVAKLVQKHLLAQPAYYAHFYRDEELIVVFPEKIFCTTPNRETWKSAVEYGKLIGIPEDELDFKPCRFEQETY